MFLCDTIFNVMAETSSFSSQVMIMQTRNHVLFPLRYPRTLKGQSYFMNLKSSRFNFRIGCWYVPILSHLIVTNKLSYIRTIVMKNGCSRRDPRRSVGAPPPSRARILGSVSGTRIVADSDEIPGRGSSAVFLFLFFSAKLLFCPYFLKGLKTFCFLFFSFTFITQQLLLHFALASSFLHTFLSLIPSPPVGYLQLPSTSGRLSPAHLPPVVSLQSSSSIFQKYFNFLCLFYVDFLYSSSSIFIV